MAHHRWWLIAVSALIEVATLGLFFLPCYGEDQGGTDRGKSCAALWLRSAPPSRSRC